MTPAEFDSVLYGVCTHGNTAQALRETKVHPQEFARYIDASKEEEARYDRAKRIGVGLMFDQMLDIADDWMLDGEHRRAMIDVRKFALVKILPRIYGDKVQLTGADGGPLVIVKDMTGRKEPKE